MRDIIIEEDGGETGHGIATLEIKIRVEGTDITRCRSRAIDRLRTAIAELELRPHDK